MATETRVVTFLFHEVRAALIGAASNAIQQRLLSRAVSRMTGGGEVDLNCIVDDYADNAKHAAAIGLAKKAFGDAYTVVGSVEVLPMKSRGDMETYWRVTAERSWRVDLK